MPKLDTTMSGSEFSQESEDEEAVRPNRFTGPSSTWQSLTAQERGLVSTLTQLRNQDLSIHLYNAHALKRKTKSEHHVSPEESDLEPGRAFNLPKSWTAWPLPVDIVPRDNEIIGPVSTDEQFTLRQRDRPFSSRGLEDMLLGVILKLAKERFDQREWNEEEDDLMQDGNSKLGNGRGRAMDSNNLPKPGNGFEDDQVDPALECSGLDLGNTQLNEDQTAAGTPSKQFSETTPLDKILMRPVVSADDERSGEILRPSVRHTLSKLDEVLMTLHHARKTCREYSLKSTGSKHSRSEGVTSDSESDAAGTPARRPRGRPRKHRSVSDRSVSKHEDFVMQENPEQWRAKSTSIGRPRKYYQRLPNETEQDYLVRVARLQKKPLPSFAPPREMKTRKRSRDDLKKATRNNIDSERARAKWETHLRPRDWSEVLGSAALAGFSPKVIANATQRCADLFRESMTMRTLIEAPVLSNNSSVLDNYIPQEFPDLGVPAETVEISSVSSGPKSDTDGSSSERPYQDPGWTQVLGKPRGFAPHTQSCFCPIDKCPRNKRGFATVSNLKRHMRKGHKMNPQQTSDFLFGDRDELSGGIHTDSFLKALLDKKTTRGRDKGQRKGGRWLCGIKAPEIKSGSDDSDSSGFESFKSQTDSDSA